MKYLIYLSTAAELLNQEQLLQILKTSRKNNSANHITGMLLYGEGTFVQVLEGDEDVVNETYSRISADQRHFGLIKMAEGNLVQRNFPEWSMGFKSANPEELDEFRGFIHPTGKGFLSDKDIHPTIILLKTFVDNNRMSDNYS